MGYVLAIISSTILFSPFWFLLELPLCVGILDIPQVCEALIIIILYSFFYFFLRLGNLNWPIFRLTDFSSSANSNVLLSSYIEIWAFVLFNSTISVFKIIFISLLMSSILCDIVLSFSFYYLYMVFFDSLNILKIADLKSLSSKSNIWDSSGTVLWTAFFPESEPVLVRVLQGNKTNRGSIYLSNYLSRYISYIYNCYLL